ncbi:MAG: cytochrome c family protein [Hyphomicrobiaceae bacterium]|jgi:cytochrome c
MSVKHVARISSATLLILLVGLGPASAQSPSAENGADVFKKCRACHLVGDTAKHAVGPALNNVIGRKAGTADGYTYSDNMRELGQSGLVWSENELSRYLENPKAVAPRGKMAFPGIADAQDRADLIAFLKTFSKP